MGYFKLVSVDADNCRRPHNVYTYKAQATIRLSPCTFMYTLLSLLHLMENSLQHGRERKENNTKKMKTQF
jgi:hypothetical protein